MKPSDLSPRHRAEYEAQIAGSKTDTAREVRKVKNKLHAQACDGYASKHEASVAGSLRALFGSERVFEQVNFPLGSKREGKRRKCIRPDFVVLLDGMDPEAERLALEALWPGESVTVHRMLIVEAKGMETDAWQVREGWAAERGLSINVLKKGR